MEAHHHYLERPRGGETGFAFAEQAHELVVDDLDDLLAGGDALQNLLTDALRLNPLHEVARNLEMNIRGEQGGAHFLQRVRHVGFRQRAYAPEVAERVA